MWKGALKWEREEGWGYEMKELFVLEGHGKLGDMDGEEGMRLVGQEGQVRVCMSKNCFLLCPFFASVGKKNWQQHAPQFKTNYVHSQKNFGFCRDKCPAQWKGDSQ